MGTKGGMVMRIHRPAAAVLAAMLLCALSARAETVRFPETGDPAFVITTPDDWTHRPDGSGNLLLIAGNKSASYALTVGPYKGTLDDLANGAMKTAGANPPQQMGPTKISGYRGYIYDTDLTNPSGVHVNVHMVAVKTGKSGMASITELTIDGIGADDYAAAQSVLTNTQITRIVGGKTKHHRK